MKIVVFGAGAVGAFFGGLLARGGQDVAFVARGTQLDALQSRGIRIDSRELGDIHVPAVRASSRVQDLGTPDLILVCVKAHQTAGIVGDLADAAGPSTMIVTLQNGVDSDEPLAGRFGRDRVFPAVVYVGATIEEPGVVSHVAAGTLEIGARGRVDRERLEAVRAALALSGRRVTIADDIQRERWNKLVWNASFNTVSAVTNRPPAELLAHQPSRTLLIGMMREVIAVAQAHGIALHDSDASRQIAWTEKAGEIRTSMMVDRQRGRAMEVEALIGVVVRRAAERSVPVPFSQALYALLTLL